MTVTNKREIDSPDIEAYRAMKLMDSGDNQAAIQKCIEAVGRFGSNRNCYLVKARAHLEQEEYGFAEEALQNVLRLDPEHPAAWAMMGEVYYRLGNETKVDYCRNRLEIIFPSLTESFTKPGDDFDEEKSADDTLLDEGIAHQDMDSIVPLENVEGKSSKLEALVDSPIEPEQVAPKRDSEKTGEIKDQTGGLRSELFETATFADICLSQGKFEKALKIYNRLLQNDPGNMKYIEKINLIKQKWEHNDSE